MWLCADVQSRAGHLQIKTLSDQVLMALLRGPFLHVYQVQTPKLPLNHPFTSWFRFQSMESEAARSLIQVVFLFLSL